MVNKSFINKNLIKFSSISKENVTLSHDNQPLMGFKIVKKTVIRGKENYLRLPYLNKIFFYTEIVFLTYKRQIIKDYIIYFLQENADWLQDQVDNIIFGQHTFVPQETDENMHISTKIASLDEVFNEYIRREVCEISNIFSIHEEFKIDNSCESILVEVKKEMEGFFKNLDDKITFMIFILENQTLTIDIFKKYTELIKEKKEVFFVRDFTHENHAEYLCCKVSNDLITFFKSVEQRGKKGEIIFFREIEKTTLSIIEKFNKDCSDLDAQVSPKIDAQKMQMKTYAYLAWKHRYLKYEPYIYSEKIQKYLTQE